MSPPGDASILFRCWVLLALTLHITLLPKYSKVKMPMNQGIAFAIAGSQQPSFSMMIPQPSLVNKRPRSRKIPRSVESSQTRCQTTLLSKDGLPFLEMSATSPLHTRRNDEEVWGGIQLANRQRQSLETRADLDLQMKTIWVSISCHCHRIRFYRHIMGTAMMRGMLLSSTSADRWGIIAIALVSSTFMNAFRLLFYYLWDEGGRSGRVTWSLAWLGTIRYICVSIGKLVKRAAEGSASNQVCCCC